MSHNHHSHNQNSTNEIESGDDANIKMHDHSAEEDCQQSSADTNSTGACCDNNLETSEDEIPSNGEQSPQDKIMLLERQLAEAKDLYVRSQAEMQNMQRRHYEDSKKTREYAISSFAKELVPVKDYLEMALKDESGNFEALKMGVDLTLKQLAQVFDNNKIKEITPKALDKLDPHLHQAMNTVEVEGQEANTVVSVMQKGYTLNDRILRPAMVTVAK